MSRTAPRGADPGPGERLRTASAEVLAEARRQVDEPEADGQEITDQSDAATASADADREEDNIAFDRMTEEDLLAGIEGLVPPEKSDDY